MNWLKNALKDFPTTALVAVTGCFLAIYTGVMYWIAVWRGWKMDELTLGLWLSFVAALCGIAFMWFGKKRDTWEPRKDWPPGKDPEDVPSVPRDTAYEPWPGIDNLPPEPVPENPDHVAVWRRDG